MKKPPKEEVKSETLEKTVEAVAAADVTWKIRADGIDGDVLETAEAWLNACSGDVLARVSVLMVIRALRAAGYRIDDDGAVGAEIEREVADLCSGTDL